MLGLAMRVTNNTRYETNALQIIATAILNSYQRHDEILTIRVRFQFSKRGRVSFTYTKHSDKQKGRVTVLLPYHEVQVRDIAGALEHGFFLANSIKPRYVPESIKNRTLTYDWLFQNGLAEKLTDPGPPPKPKLTEQQREEAAAYKIHRIEELEKKWAAKLKRAQTMLLKLKKQKSYYRNVLRGRETLLQEASERADWDL